MFVVIDWCLLVACGRRRRCSRRRQKKPDCKRKKQNIDWLEAKLNWMENFAYMEKPGERRLVSKGNSLKWITKVTCNLLLLLTSTETRSNNRTVPMLAQN